ncbi:hypothetical protein [Mesorhizobium sp. M1348]|uniref:hypothetical protein n=1 Tax=unclassified Mesorhizobium TaxID=325217 RepID=UPI0033359604
MVAFFRGLADGKFKAEPIFFQAQGDLVVDVHRGWSNVGSGPEIDQLYALMFRIKDGKIAEAQNFLTDMYQSDAFYWAHYPLTPLPGRLAGERWDGGLSRNAPRFSLQAKGDLRCLKS